VDGACATCSAEVLLPGETVTQWAKKVWHNSSMGLEWERDAFLRAAYGDARKVGESIYGRMGGREVRAPIRVPRIEVLRWADGLEDAASASLADADGDGETRHLLDLMDLATTMREAASPRGATALPRAPAAPVPPPPTTRFVTDREIPRVVAQLVGSAKKELLIVSPWIYGVDNLVKELVGTSGNVRVRIITRRAASHEAGHARTLDVLADSGLVQFETPAHVHAKLIVCDEATALVGSANLVQASMERNQEAAILTTERSVVEDAREYFDRMWREARQERTRLAPR
jgi:phosphatidylserine/phosphatidylglycerophosphate/cardiolipin synthase-like enzyme